MIRVELPIKTVNRKNRREHRMATARRTTSHRAIVRMTLAASHPRGLLEFHLGVTVLLTRISPGTLDEHDNLRLALSDVVDGVADSLGVADNSPRVTWLYAQEKRTRSRASRLPIYGVRIEIRPRGET